MPGRLDIPSVIAKEDLLKLPEKIRKKRIEETAISHFTTKEQCEEMAKQHYRKDLKRMDKAEAEARKKRFGEYIVKLDYKKGDGLVGPVEDGHFNFHPYEGVDFKSRIDWQFGAKTLKYEQANDIIFVGDLQVYTESYASLYYSGSTKTYFISVRLSSIDNPEKKYATTIISPKQIVDYLNDKIGLRTILSEGIYTSASPKPNVKTIKKTGLKQEDISRLLTKEDKFDPDYCLDMSDILYFIWKHNQINLDTIRI